MLRPLLNRPKKAEDLCVSNTPAPRPFRDPEAGRCRLPLGRPGPLVGGYVGGCQDYGPFLGPYYNTGPNTGPNLGDPKRDHKFDNPPCRGRKRRLSERP